MPFRMWLVQWLLLASVACGVDRHANSQPSRILRSLSRPTMSATVSATPSATRRSSR